MPWVLYWSYFYFPRFITMRDGHWIFGSIFCRISMFTNCVTVSQHKEIQVNCSTPALIHRSTPRCSLCWQWPWRDTGRSWPRWPRGSHTTPPPPHHHQHNCCHHHHHYHHNNQARLRFGQFFNEKVLPRWESKFEQLDAEGYEESVEKSV